MSKGYINEYGEFVRLQNGSKGYINEYGEFVRSQNGRNTSSSSNDINERDNFERIQELDATIETHVENSPFSGLIIFIIAIGLIFYFIITKIVIPYYSQEYTVVSSAEFKDYDVEYLEQIIQTEDNNYLGIGWSDTFMIGRSGDLILFDENGFVKWEKTNIGQGVKSIVKDGNNYITLVSYVHHSYNIYKFGINKYDSKGVKLWEKTYDNKIEKVLPYKIVRNPNGYIIFGVSLVKDLNTNKYNNSIFICQIDRMGNLGWKKSFGKYKRDEKINTLSIISNNGSYTIIYKNDISSKLHLLKINNYGSQILQKTIEAYRGKIAYSILDQNHIRVVGCNKNNIFNISFDKNGNLLSKKDFHLPLSYDIKNVIFSKENNGLIAIGTKDGFFSQASIVKMDKDGKIRWEGSYGDVSYFNHVKILKDGYFLVGGKSETIHTIHLKKNQNVNSQTNSDKIKQSNTIKVAKVKYKNEVATAKYSVNINTTPSDAKIEITNSKDVFYQGIKLKNGRYNVEISRQGYKPYSKFFELTKDSVLDVVLQKKRIVGSNIFPTSQAQISLNKQGNIASNSLTNKNIQKYSIRFNVIPIDAKIEIINIKDIFHQGIKLKNGKYNVEISRQGYKPYSKFFELTKDSIFDVVLEKERIKINISNNNMDFTSEDKAHNELQNKSAWELKVMRNEIYARHGYIFKTDKMRNYFQQQSWYEPKFNNVDHLLTDIDRANIEKIKQYEK